MLAINSIHSPYNDAEYLLILQELRRLGLAPTGNKSTDKMKLEQAKAELIHKIQEREQESQKQSLQIQTVDAVDEAEYAKRSEMEEQRLGAMTVAELNRYFLVLR